LTLNLAISGGIFFMIEKNDNLLLNAAKAAISSGFVNY
jgi:hypothetical protein